MHVLRPCLLHAIALTLTDHHTTLTVVVCDPFSADPNAPRKRRSRWGDAKTDIPGLLHCYLCTGVSQAQLSTNYGIHLRLEEINRKLEAGTTLSSLLSAERYASSRLTV